MKETAIEVTVFRKGMTLQEMNEFAQSIKAQYDQGYAHHEGFDAGDMAVIVMKREFEVVQELAPDFQGAAQTLDKALSQANQTIEYLRNEIAVLRNGNSSMMSMEDAKTLANVAYNRGRSIGDLHCQLDFEHWWVEFRKENGFATEQPIEEPYHPESIESVYEKLKGMASEFMRWADLENFYVVFHDEGFQEFNTAVHQELGFSMTSKFHKESEAKITEGITRADYLYWMATQIYTQLTTIKDAPKPKADHSSHDVFEQLYMLAKEHLTWHDLEAFVTTKDRDFNKFWTRMQQIYGIGCVSSECIGVINNRTNQGCRRLEYLKLITNEIVANQDKQ